jgi:Tol biopolymer transport system component/DNA-binding winged helix-turn-helix (wHTH) protein
MLKTHQNLLEPRPSDRLRVGDRLVDLSLREISPLDGSVEPVRVTLKSIAVLLTLVAHAGKLVSREALLEWVWPDTLPTDDVVTQAITQLRKALGDDRECPRYIDTVAKQGYRLIATVEWLVEPEVEATAAAVSASTTISPAQAASISDAMPERAKRSRRVSVVRIVVAALALAAGVSIAMYYKSRREAAASPETAAARAVTDVPVDGMPIVVAMPSYQRIASKPQGEYRPTLSPDGALLAYVEEGEGSLTSSLWVQTTAPVPPQRLTEPVNGQWDMMPVWSPDGRHIAFIRENEQRCSIMLIPATGGGARDIGECLGGSGHRINWYPDGKALVGARVPAGYRSLSRPKPVEKALYRMSLDRGRWERIAYERSPNDEDMLPAVSPDGRWIAFQRSLSLGDLWRIPVAGGKPERLTHLRGNFYGIAWKPDSSGLMFGHYVRGRAVIAELDLESRRVYHYRDNGSDSMLNPSIARNGSALVFEIETLRSVVRGVDLPSAGEVSSADSAKSPLTRSAVLFETTGSNQVPSIAPDGRQLIFASDRSAELRMWWVDQTQPESLRAFDDFVPIARYPVVWDAASKQALAIGEGAGGLGVYELDPRSGRATKLPVPNEAPVHAAYHPNPMRLLVVADRGEGRLGVALYDRSVRPWRILAEIDDVAIAIPDPIDERIVLARTSNSEIWQSDLSLGQARRIDRTTIQRRNRSLTISPDGAWVMDSAPDCAWRWRRVARANATPVMREVCLGDQDWSLVGLSYHAGQQRLYLSMVEQSGSDIALVPFAAMRNARP